MAENNKKNSIKVSFRQVGINQMELEAKVSRIFALIFEEVIRDEKNGRAGKLGYVVVKQTIKLSLTYCIKAV